MKSDFRKVLVIAYYFPPMGLSGVQRTAKFMKYLPKYGWKPTVLTVSPTGYYAVDTTLLEEVEQAGTEIVRASSLDPNRLFKSQGVVKMPSERVRKILQFAGDTVFVPDTKIGWKSKALKAATDLLATPDRFSDWRGFEEEIRVATGPGLSGCMARLPIQILSDPAAPIYALPARETCTESG
jgi:hypothetical protein